jgi:hypothetical protein
MANEPGRGKHQAWPVSFTTPSATARQPSRSGNEVRLPSQLRR